MPDQSSPAGAVFLSYASQDTEAVERICAALRASGVEVWLDKSELRGGDAWDAQIKRQIHECTLFMPVISAHTNARAEGYFRREWNLATRRLLDMSHDAVFLVPVVIDETREVDARVPEEFLSAHWTRLPGGETPPAFAQRVRQLLCGDGAAARAAHSTITGQAPRTAREAVTGWPLARSRAWRIGLMGVAALVAALLAYGWYVREQQAGEAATTPAGSSLATTDLPSRSIAVLPFDDRGGSSGTGVLAEGIPETVLHQLALMQGLTVIARGSSFAFKGHNEDMRVIGRKLNVRYLLEGSVQTAGDRLRVTSSLIDAQTGASVWSRQFNPAPQDVFAVQDEIALEVARALQLTIDSAGGSAAGPRRVGTENFQAYFEFLRGRALLASVRVAELPAAINALNAAIRLDPTFASAYVLLARAKVLQAEQSPVGTNLLESFPQAVENAMGLLNEAIELDPRSGEAYVERGYLKLYFDVAAADADLRRGLELAPNYARGYEGLAAVMFQSVARRREALVMIEKARRLDPLELRLDVIKATYLDYGSGDFVQAAQLLETVLERDPLFVPALVRLTDCRWLMGEHAEAIALGEQAVALDPGNDPAWRQLMGSYLSVAEPAAAEDASRHAADHALNGSMWLHVYRKDWQKAGEGAYALIAAGPSYFQNELLIALAIRKHAKVTGDYQRAIEALEVWAAVTWDGDEPVLEGQLDLGYGVAALADMLVATGQQDQAQALLKALLANADLQVNRYGRGEAWLNGGRAIAFAMLGRPEEAIAVLQRQAKSGFLSHLWRFSLEDEPTFDSLRARKDFQALLADVRANEAREREQFLRMRAEGQLPNRT